MAVPSTALHIASALAENVYRRSTTDQAVSIGDIGANAKTVNAPTLSNPDAGYYYNYATGFVGSIN